MHPQETKEKANEYLPDSRQRGLTGCRWGGAAMLTWSCSDDCWPLTPALTPPRWRHKGKCPNVDPQMWHHAQTLTTRLSDHTRPVPIRREKNFYRRIILPAVKEGQYLPVRLDLYPGVLSLEQVWVELTAAPHTLMPSLWRWFEVQRQSTLNQ